MMTIPFLPASNLFFPVGFVLAERVLYIPSMGFSMLIAIGFYRLCQKNIFGKKFLQSCLVFLIAVHSLKTISRNFDWKDESAIFISGKYLKHAKSRDIEWPFNNPLPLLAHTTATTSFFSQPAIVAWNVYSSLKFK